MKKVLLLLLVFTGLGDEAWSGASTGAIGTHKSVKEFLGTLEEQSQKEADQARQMLRFVRRDPFVPQQMDYGVEFGTFWQHDNFYNLGANIGWHVGTCIFSDSETCQQFLDFIGNLSGRESHTLYSGLASLRWQFVSFPSSWSQLTRVFVGGRHGIEPRGNSQALVYGVGWGVTTYLHPKADLRVEFRVGAAEQKVFSEVMLSVQLKIDRWIEYFAGKVKDLGIGTVDLTGQVVKGTVNVTGDVVKGTVGVTGDVVKGTVGVTKDVVTGTVGVTKDVVTGTVGATGQVIDAVGGAALKTVTPAQGPAPSPSPKPSP